MICTSCQKKITKSRDVLVAVDSLMQILGSYSILEEKIDVPQMEEWLKELHSDENGFRDYFRYRDLQILKGMGMGQDEKTYWMNVGRRAELLYLVVKGIELLKKDKQEEIKAKALVPKHEREVSTEVRSRDELFKELAEEEKKIKK